MKSHPLAKLQLGKLGFFLSAPPSDDSFSPPFMPRFRLLLSKDVEKKANNSCAKNLCALGSSGRKTDIYVSKLLLLLH